jgi:hypothetical protein
LLLTEFFEEGWVFGSHGCGPSAVVFDQGFDGWHGLSPEYVKLSFRTEKR